MLIKKLFTTDGVPRTHDVSPPPTTQMKFGKQNGVNYRPLGPLTAISSNVAANSDKVRFWPASSGAVHLISSPLNLLRIRRDFAANKVSGTWKPDLQTHNMSYY